MANFFDDIALRSTRNPGSRKLVLGKWNEGGRSYVRVGAHFDATYFKLKGGKKTFEALGREGAWEVNRAFLQRQLRSGKEIILSHCAYPPIFDHETSK